MDCVSLQTWAPDDMQLVPVEDFEDPVLRSGFLYLGYVGRNVCFLLRILRDSVLILLLCGCNNYRLCFTEQVIENSRE